MIEILLAHHGQIIQIEGSIHQLATNDWVREDDRGLQDCLLADLVNINDVIQVLNWLVHFRLDFWLDWVKVEARVHQASIGSMIVGFRDRHHLARFCDARITLIHDWHGKLWQESHQSIKLLVRALLDADKSF